MRRPWPWFALAGSLLAGCAAGPALDVEAMAAAAVPPDETAKARLTAEDVRALLPAGLQGVEVSNVAALPNGDHWLCLRGQAAEPDGSPRPFTAVVVLSRDAALVGAQADCPSCRAAALGWQAFPAMDGARTPGSRPAPLDGTAALTGS